jgi:hypothetical protein
MRIVLLAAVSLAPVSIAVAQDTMPPESPGQSSSVDSAGRARVQAGAAEAEVHTQTRVQAHANPNVQVNIVDAPAEPPGVVIEQPPPPAEIFLHGFRIGYLTILDIDGPVSANDPSETYADRYGIRSAHMFMLGYEATWRMIGYDWLNLLLIGNVLVAGLEQSRFFPSANLMLGFELVELAQLGVGASFTPTKDEPAHMVFAAGFTPLIGSFYVPLHVFFVPDIEGHHKLGVTLGVNFF